MSDTYILLIPTLGSRGPQWGPVDLICLSLCLYVRLPALLSGDHKSAASNYVKPMRPQATGSNPLSGSIIFPSAVLLQFFICIIFQCGVQHRDIFSPHWGPESPSGVQ